MEVYVRPAFLVKPVGHSPLSDVGLMLFGLVASANQPNCACIPVPFSCICDCLISNLSVNNATIAYEFARLLGTYFECALGTLALASCSMLQKLEFLSFAYLSTTVQNFSIQTCWDVTCDFIILRGSLFVIPL